ncbi:MAG: chorismate-binding protein [Steroidobacteraceae bacterium]|jgi:para-aminobenzoate synthetase component 1
MSRRAVTGSPVSLQQAAQSLRARGVPFAALVSAAARAGLGRRSLLATALTPVELEASNLARLRGSGREAYRRALQAEWRTATQRAFASGAKGVLVLVSHEAAELFDDFATHEPWLNLPRIQLWAAFELAEFEAGEPWVSHSVERLPLNPLWDASTHASALQEVQAAIAAGELYQACLTYPIKTPVPTDPGQLFARWLMEQPVDHAAWVHLPRVVAQVDPHIELSDFELLCCSPERFFSLRAGEVFVQPMKGTRAIPAGAQPEQVAAIAQALATSSKDRAENIMIVDLMRNDLGRVCRPGSVKLEALCQVDTYASVAQMTSTVVGQLEQARDIWDVLAACFPPGSMTGAPKIEATRWIRQLESGPRGMYGGALGWLEPNGDAEFNVVIRSLQCYRGQARWDVGGGIVADSTVGEEWEETRAKAALLSG